MLVNRVTGRYLFDNSTNTLQWAVWGQKWADNRLRGKHENELRSQNLVVMSGSESYLSYFIGPWELGILCCQYSSIREGYMYNDYVFFVELPTCECQRDLIDILLTIVYVMAWCRQATSYHLMHCLGRIISPNDVTGPQCVKEIPIKTSRAWFIDADLARIHNIP